MVKTTISWSSAAWMSAPVHTLASENGAMKRSTASGWLRRHSSGTEKAALMVNTSGAGTCGSAATVRQPPDETSRTANSTQQVVRTPFQTDGRR